MNVLDQLRQRFAAALVKLTDQDLDQLVEMIKPSQDARFGDYQANCAMPLGKRFGKAPREVAQQIVDLLQIDDICQPAEIAGPGFINLRVRDDWLLQQLSAALTDVRLAIAPAEDIETFVVDYSAPNVAKPMHVGHVRSTVIGDALARTLKFLGHTVITDNHIGDWGTQFGMIIYGYKHFLDQAAYDENPVAELARLYRLVNQLIGYQADRSGLPALEEKIATREGDLQRHRELQAASEKQPDKKAAKAVRRAESQVKEARDELAQAQQRIASIDNDSQLAALASQHATIGQAVLSETAALHADDETNLALWRQFMPICIDDIERIYRRLGVSFDHTLGESFYHDRLSGVVQDLSSKGLAEESDGAVCVFLDDQPVPMIVQKKDGAFLYATTDLATIQYRVETWHPDAILYVVDHRQSLHFDQLFGTVWLWGYQDVELAHVRFGTVLGEDGRPFKTRSGATVGLDGLLDEAVRRAFQVVSENDDAKPERELTVEQRQTIAEVVGIAALKYADLSQNRESDYVFSYDKMLALNGNTATYMQYAYARIRNIFAKGKIDVGALVGSIRFTNPTERTLGVALLRFSEALEQCVADYRPNQITGYLFELANHFSTFYNECPVLQADTEAQRTSRLLLCDLTGRTLKTGLSLLGIDVVEKM